MPKLQQKDVAKRLKVTPQYVSKLVRQEKIKVDRNGLIDLAKAKAALKAWARPGRVVKQAKAQARRAGKASAAGRVRKAKVATPRRESATASIASYRATREKWESEKSRLEVEEKLKKLLPAADVLAAEHRKNANIRTRFRRLGRTLAPALAQISDPGEIEERVLDEVDRLLAELAEDPLAEVPAEAVPVLQTSAEVLPPAQPPAETREVQQ